MVSPGFQTNLVVDREFKSMLPKPYSQCEIDNSNRLLKLIPNMDLFNLIVNSKYEYSQSLCFMQCLQQIVLQKYNCSIKFWLSHFNASNCVFTSNLTLNNFSFNEICLSQCPLIFCQTLYTTTSISFNQLNGKSFLKKIRNNSRLRLDFVNRNLNDFYQVIESILFVNIFY